MKRFARQDHGPSMTEKVVAVHRALAEARLPHAIGGALALAYYGEPRTTVDIDVNVFVPVSRRQEVGDELEPLGVEVEADEGVPDREHEMRLAWDRNTVHLFFSYDALHAAMPDAVRQVPFAGGSIPIVSPEHLVVRKVSLDRSKDWVDVETVLVATDSLEVAEIQRWLRRLVGPEDPRLVKFEDLARRLLS